MKQVKNRRGVVVGIFIFLGVLILAGGVLVLGGQRKAFDKTITLYAIFNDVAGLQKGNNVWFSGVKVGIVQHIKLISTNSVSVEMKIDKQATEFIFKDSKIKVGSDGLIGNKILVIYGGTPGIAKISQHDTLQSGIPLNSAEMMNTLQESNKNLSAITTDVKTISGRLVAGEGSIGQLLVDDKFARQLQATTATLQTASINIQVLTANLAAYTEKMKTRGLMHDLVTDTVFFKTLSASAQQIHEASANAKEMTDNLRMSTAHLKDSSSVAGVLLYDQQSATDMRTAIDNIQSGTKKFDEDMEALQHNFLFRGFFRKRAKAQQKQQKQQQEQTRQAVGEK